MQRLAELGVKQRFEKTRDLKTFPSLFMSTDTKIKVTDLHFAYMDKPVLKGISLSIELGEFVGLIGPNGSGKTTFFRILSGVLRPQRGTIEINGRRIGSYHRKDLAQLIAVVPQETVVTFPFSVTEIVLMGRAPYLKGLAFEKTSDLEIVRKSLEETDVLPLADRLISELSGGEKQRVIIARALTQEPQIMLLDEPTSFLDIKHQLDVYDLLHRLNMERRMTVIAVSHDLNLAAQYCSRILLLNNGQVVSDGSPEKVITEENISEVYGAEVLIEKNEVIGSPFVIPLSASAKKVLKLTS